jgi:uroporphyrinogen-III synthase
VIPTLAVLRPEPGNAATAARATAAGFAVLRLPLFEIVPLAWDAPDPHDHDALVLTSANTVRHAGAGLHDLIRLPVVAVGEQTAIAARAAGLRVAVVGSNDAAALAGLLAQRGFDRALHLGGRDHISMADPARTIAVYASEPIAIEPARVRDLAGTIALLHSARAAERLAAVIDRVGIARGEIAVAAFSPAIALAAGLGWKAVATAATPSDAALFAAIAALGR